MFEKFQSIVVLVFSVFLLVFVLINLVDEPSRQSTFTMKDLPAAPWKNTNGFFILWGLGEPKGVDVLSDGYIDKIRKMDEQPWYLEKHRKFSQWIKAIRFPRHPNQDWISMLIPQAEAVYKAKQKCAVVLKRYRLLINTPLFRDFCQLKVLSPTPPLMLWLRTAKLFIAIQCLDAANGNWKEAAGQLLDNIDFGKRANAGSRVMITQLIAKGNTYLSLHALASILNHPECPPQVYQLVLSRMPPITYHQYGCRNIIISECLRGFIAVDEPGTGLPGMPESICFDLIPTTIFFKKNTTKNYFVDITSAYLAYDKQPPHQWKAYPWNERSKHANMETSFWWVYNPTGKYVFSLVSPKLGSAIYKGHRLRATYDMTRIMAEFHLKHIPGSDVKTTLNRLESYKTIDLCSGKQYLYSAAKKCLYSIGPDQKNNDGTFVSKVEGSDFIISISAKKQL